LKKTAERARIILKGFHEELTMKKPVLLFLFILIFNFLIFTQEIIENPEKSLSKYAGRVVELVEVMSIDDVGIDYFFKYPRNPKVAPDGSLFVMDHEQLLQFDREGNFLRNYFKKGQGPEEMQNVSNYFFSVKCHHCSRSPAAKNSLVQFKRGIYKGVQNSRIAYFHKAASFL